ncbi:MAG: lamin tail domain-containing protein, partial [Chitinophagales bacterium]|nr:lamin tail domain-containing protein [Chitinophagales bacterium]
MQKYLHFVVAFLILLFSFQKSFSQVVINEYSASNRNLIVDNFGKNEDYIELYNTTGASVDLTGWYLTDDYADLTKWQFPAGSTIAANGFKKIWASNKDTVIGTNYHTSFKLTQTKFDKLALSNPSAQIVDSVSLLLTLKDHARGRTTNGGSTWGVFTSPTPGTSNGASFSEYVAKPVADIPAGFYTAAQTITLTDVDATAKIYYTTDGSIPTTLSTLYTIPITVSITTLIRAKAFSSLPNLLGSFEEVNTYFINVTYDPHYYVLSFSSDDYDAMFNSWGTWDIDSYFEFFDKNHVQQSEGMGKVDPHGNDSWAYPQKGIDFEMEDDYGYAHTIPYKIFTDKDRPSYDHIIIKAGASDNYPFSWGDGPAHMRDAYIHTLSLRHKLDIDVRTYEPAIVYINGAYWGLYEVREKADDVDYTDYYYNQKEEDIDLMAFWGGLDIKFGSDVDWNSLYYYMQANPMT